VSRNKAWVIPLALLLLTNVSMAQSQAEIFDNKVTNEINLLSTLTLPDNKSKRGETVFELVMSDAHFERSQATCPGSRYGGQTAFKVIGASEDWEKSISSNNSLALATILMSDGGGYLTSTFGGGGPTKIGGIAPSVSANGFAKKVAFKFKTNGWKSGEYTLIGFLDDGCRGFSMVTLRMTLPEIPKTQIACQAPDSVFAGDSFKIGCSSTLDLAANGVILEQKVGSDWQTVSEALATGMKFNFDSVRVSDVKLIEFRVRLIGIQDQLEDSTSLSFYIQSNAAKLTIRPVLELSKNSEKQQATVRFNSGNYGLSGTIQSAKSPNGPWKDVSQISSTSQVKLDLPFGTWVRVGFEGNTTINSGSTDPYQILITPILKCTFPSKIESGVKFKVICTSNQILQKTPINLQYLNSSGNWVSISKGLGSGAKQSFTFQLDGLGNQKLRIQSEGLKDAYSVFSSNISAVGFTAAKSKSSTPSADLGSGSIPKGAVDKKSNSYKLMFNFGGNVAAGSLATDSALAQCVSAKNSGIVRVRGIPQYLGVQAVQIQSYLNTASGFQGCLDGFGK
jgi:hypothetical protein